MSNSLMFLQLIAMALVIYIPFMRFRLFRKLVGFADLNPNNDRGNGSGFEQRLVHIIAKAGKDRAVEQDGVLTFRCTLGMKTVTIALIGLLVYQMIILGFSSMMDMFYFVIFLGACLYFVSYVLIFRLQIYDSEIVWIDWFLRERSHDLSQLFNVEQDSSGGYRLEFQDGKTAYIFRYVEGHGILKDFLLAALRINRSTEIATGEWAL